MLRAAAPVIETARLTLRAFAPEDFPAFCDLWNDPAVYRHITGKPLADEDNWSRLLKLVGHWQFVGYGSWAVVDKGSSAMIGQVGFNDYRRDMPVPMPEPEMGWALRAEAQGKGLASEACTAALAWLDRECRPEVVACIIAPENAPSQALAKKLGFMKVADTTYKAQPTLLFHRKKPVV
jgi:RimJ/RimL family protein N-acetyltransferase